MHRKDSPNNTGMPSFTVSGLVSNFPAKIMHRIGKQCKITQITCHKIKAFNIKGNNRNNYNRHYLFCKFSRKKSKFKMWRVHLILVSQTLIIQVELAYFMVLQIKTTTFTLRDSWLYEVKYVEGKYFRVLSQESADVDIFAYCLSLKVKHRPHCFLHQSLADTIRSLKKVYEEAWK